MLDVLDRVVDGGAPIAANRALAAVRKLFNWCVARDVLATSPCAGVKPPTAERSRDRVLSDDELRLVWQAADQIGSPFGPLVKLLALTGQRRDEVGRMQWSELDLDKQLWTLPAERVKNNQPHHVPLSDAALAVLKDAPQIVGSPSSSRRMASCHQVHIRGTNDVSMHCCQRTCPRGDCMTCDAPRHRAWRGSASTCLSSKKF